MRDFKKLEIWQLGMNIVDQVYTLFEEVPWQKTGKLRDQAERSAVSIASNIAEGNSRRSEKDKYRFHEIALGSAFELQTQILIVQRRNWVPQDRLSKLLDDIELEQKKLAAFMGILGS
ncbi:MAG: four helix bundle protein [Flavobacteriales bacterium]|jgi:four helix bundle protein|nr:four helix bundle protein [Flavobacteriales bacterium]